MRNNTNAWSSLVCVGVRALRLLLEALKGQGTTKEHIVQVHHIMISSPLVWSPSSDMG